MLQEFHNEIAIYYIAGTLSLVLLITAIIFYVFLHQKKVNAFRNQLQLEEIKKQQAIFKALREGEEKERNRISEELHDGVNTRLAGLNMNIDYLLPTLNGIEYDLLNKTHSGISNIINELREISHNLQPIDFNETDFESLVYDYIEQLNSKKECHYSWYVEPDAVTFSTELKLHCYRIITELLYNIHKHAKASHASAQVTCENDTIEIIIEDNGVGFSNNQPNSGGIGLNNIKGRVTVCKGFMNIDSSPKGTTIIIELPLK